MKQSDKLVPLAACAVITAWVAFTTTAIANEDTTNLTMPFEDSAPETSITETGTIGRSANVESKLSAEFAEFLGGDEQAATVVEGLRTGDEFHLPDAETDPDATASTAPGQLSTGDAGSQPVVDQPTTGTNIDPPTGTMGYGNVRITLKLAQAQLEQLGISQPTNEQLSAALVGGEIDGVAMEGILNERAAGAGWGEIAQRYDLKVGQLMGKAPTTKSAPTIPVEEQNAAASTATTSRSNGYIPSGKTKFTHAAQAAGNKAQRSPTHGAKRNGYIPSGSSAAATTANRGAAAAGSARGNGAKNNGYIPSGDSQGSGAGIVSAHGAGGASHAKVKQGAGKGPMKGYVASGGAHSAGIVSATNASGAAAVSAAGGHGQAKGHAKGHGKAK
jgi:hypothetical protein